MPVNLTRTSALTLLLALLGGCASTPEAPPGSDADAKRFETAPNAAIIYLYRPRTPGGDAPSTIWVDGRLIGETLPTTFFRVAVRPGHNRISASGNDMGRLDIDTEADGVYFVEMQVLGETQGASTTIFRSVKPDIGKASVLHCCAMLETWRPGQSRFNF